MGLFYETITSLIGTPANFAGEIVFWTLSAFLAYIVVMGMWVAVVRLLTR